MNHAKNPYKILLVDDETAVLEVMTSMLKHLGYEVITTSCSINALDLFRKDPNQFDLVIADITMPHMTGDILAKKIIEIRIGMPVILYSGYSQNFTEKTANEIGVRKFLKKPINLEDMSEAISKVLEVEYQPPLYKNMLKHKFRFQHN
jgi:DNA-binding NtrC family response regulator